MGGDYPWTIEEDLPPPQPVGEGPQPIGDYVWPEKLEPAQQFTARTREYGFAGPLIIPTVAEILELIFGAWAIRKGQEAVKKAEEERRKQADEPPVRAPEPILLPPDPKLGDIIEFPLPQPYILPMPTRLPAPVVPQPERLPRPTVRPTPFPMPRTAPIPAPEPARSPQTAPTPRPSPSPTPKPIGRPAPSPSPAPAPAPGRNPFLSPLTPFLAPLGPLLFPRGTPTPRLTRSEQPGAESSPQPFPSPSGTTPGNRECCACRGPRKKRRKKRECIRSVTRDRKTGRFA